jgi:threonine dehydrogenase-like Zn-dependent dehydrogenase
MAKLISDIYELAGPHQLVLRQETIDLDDLKPNEVAARTVVSVLSPGTELAAYVGAPPLRPIKVYPRVNGYCNVAEVVAVGAAVEGVRTGDQISTHQSHRSAFRCDAGRINAVLSSQDDAIAQATLYLWHLGYYPLIRGGVQAGHNVAILGLGTLGLTAVAMSKLAGCNVVAYSDRAIARQKALEFGADLVLAKADMAISQKKLREVTNGVGVDLIIFTSNSWEDWEFALQTARDGGAIAVLGFPGRGLGSPEFNPLGSQHLYDKELTIISCGNPPACDVSPRDLRFTLKRNYAYLSSIIRQQRIPATAIVSDVVDWRELNRVYRRLEQREDGLMTVALKWM